MRTPVQSAGQGLVKAYLEVRRPKVPDPVIPLQFNPSEYQLQKTNNFAEIGIPGLESPPIQFIRGAAEKLSCELLVDTSDTLDDVRTKYVDPLRDLMRVDGKLHAPPIVRLAWAKQQFEGVLESLSTTFTLFTPDGVPLRAKLNVTLKEYRPAAVQLDEEKRESPDVEKTYLVRRGDTLSGIATSVYGDPSLWRAIADANRLVDPRSIQSGTKLFIPAIR